MKYRNPVIPGFYPDPSVCRVGRDFYLVTSSFEYFPGVPVFHSRDLVHWRQIGHCLTRKSQLSFAAVKRRGGIYAPTLRHHDGRFYMVTTHAGMSQNFYVRAEDPAGEWSDPIPVDQGGIDPSLLFNRDGTVYFTSNAGLPSLDQWGGIWQCTIDIETGRRLTRPRRVWAGTGGAYPEAPHLYHIGRRYYLMIAEGGTEYGHMVTIARSAKPFGPFTSCPRNPVLSHRSLRSPIQGTGHADLVQDHRGRWWMVCLAFRPTMYPPRHHLGRETFLAPVAWGKDGWPVVGKDGTIGPEMNAACLPRHGFDPEPVRDDFDSAQPALCWVSVRNPRPRSRTLTERPGWLRLRGAAETLSGYNSPSVLLRRQQHFDCRATALLDFAPAADGEEAGVTAYYNDRFHYEIAVARREGKRCIITRRTLGTLSSEENRIEIPPGAVELAIEADARQYHFSWAHAGGRHHEIQTGECAMLAKEVTGGYTGVCLGMYATGSGRPCSVPADFDWFDYEVLPEKERMT
jgi:alpha-N-arabinofuranosidase